MGERHLFSRDKFIHLIHVSAIEALRDVRHAGLGVVVRPDLGHGPRVAFPGELQTVTQGDGIARLGSTEQLVEVEPAVEFARLLAQCNQELGIRLLFRVTQNAV